MAAAQSTKDGPPRQPSTSTGERVAPGPASQTRGSQPPPPPPGAAAAINRQAGSSLYRIISSTSGDAGGSTPASTGSKRPSRKGRPAPQPGLDAFVPGAAVSVPPSPLCFSPGQVSGAAAPVGGARQPGPRQSYLYAPSVPVHGTATSPSGSPHSAERQRGEDPTQSSTGGEGQDGSTSTTGATAASRATAQRLPQDDRLSQGSATSNFPKNPPRQPVTPARRSTAPAVSGRMARFSLGGDADPVTSSPSTPPGASRRRSSGRDPYVLLIPSHLVASVETRVLRDPRVARLRREAAGAVSREGRDGREPPPSPLGGWPTEPDDDGGGTRVNEAIGPMSGLRDLVLRGRADGPAPPRSQSLTDWTGSGVGIIGSGGGQRREVGSVVSLDRWPPTPGASQLERDRWGSVSIPLQERGATSPHRASVVITLCGRHPDDPPRRRTQSVTSRPGVTVKNVRPLDTRLRGTGGIVPKERGAIVPKEVKDRWDTDSLSNASRLSLSSRVSIRETSCAVVSRTRGSVRSDVKDKPIRNDVKDQQPVQSDVKNKPARSDVIDKQPVRSDVKDRQSVQSDATDHQPAQRQGDLSDQQSVKSGAGRLPSRPADPPEDDEPCCCPLAESACVCVTTCCCLICTAPCVLCRLNRSLLRSARDAVTGWRSKKPAASS